MAIVHHYTTYSILPSSVGILNSVKQALCGSTVHLFAHSCISYHDLYIQGRVYPTEN
jgi:hypothetical protein